MTDIEYMKLAYQEAIKAKDIDEVPIGAIIVKDDCVIAVSYTHLDVYKRQGEDLYLIGTSEHSMIGKFKDQIVKEDDLPITMTSYSPCFRKEVGAHGIEERGIYRVHQFEKQEMVVLCKPEDAMEWYDKMWSYTVELFRSLDIPVRTLECCSEMCIRDRVYMVLVRVLLML